MRLFRKRPPVGHGAIEEAPVASLPDDPPASELPLPPESRQHESPAPDRDLVTEDPYAELGIPREAVAPKPVSPERPPVEHPEDGDPDAPLLNEPPFERLRSSARPHAGEADDGDTAPRRPRIWDLEIDDVPPAPPAAEPPQPDIPDDDVALARAQIARFSQAGLTPGEAPLPTGRAKTRVLGFSAAAFVEGDPFARGPGKAPEGRFPVGWMVVAVGPGRGASFTLFAGVSSIGRGADHAVCLDFGDTSISRANHASIAYDDEVNRFFLGQGGKSNIVRLNGRPVLSTEDLADGDLIRIGETTLRFTALCGEGFRWDDAGGSTDVAAE